MNVRAASLAVTALCVGACATASGRPATVLVIAPTTGSSPVVSPLVGSGPSPPVDRGFIRGIGGVEVGQTVAELRHRLGDELRIDPLDKERAAFASFGYDVGHNVPFILGFDSVYVFNDDTLRSEPPIWKVYVKDDRATVIKISTVGFEEHLKEHRVGFPPSCFLLDEPAGIFQTFGQAFIEEQLSDHVTYHYLDRGISVLVFGDAIRVFDVFGDVGDEARGRIRAGLEKPTVTP